MMSQKSEMRAALKRGESFTRLDALLRWGCAKAPARISELRQEGLPIKTEIVEGDGKRFARWYMPSDEGMSTS
jgi:hypothetical protein